MSDVQSILNEYGIFDERAIKKLANEVAWLLIKADPTDRLNASVMAFALVTTETDIDKQNAIDLAHSFGKLVAEYIDENWDRLIVTRRRAVELLDAI